MMKVVFKVFTILFLAINFVPEVIAQKTKPLPKARPGATAKNDKAAFDKAKSLTDKFARIEAFRAFVEKFPQSAMLNDALEEIAVARTEIAVEKFKFRQNAEAIELLRLVVNESPAPYSDRLHDSIIGKIPFNLMYLNERASAFEFAKAIEKKIGENSFRYLNLANFYIANEEAEEAVRLAEKAVSLEPNSSQAHEIAGLAYRYHFDLEEAAKSYGKALELNPYSLVARRGLADMKRALGEFQEAVNLYRSIIIADEKDNQARTGLVLSLLSLGKTAEAEEETDAALERQPNNLSLFTGMAYWYIAHGDAQKAEDVAQEAIAVEPRSVWAHIALARSQIALKKPLEAEKTLLQAKQYGNFPTLDYELANARFHAGFFEEATEDLRRVFVLKDGKLITNLGNRIAVAADDFVTLLQNERRSGIFQFTAADSPENAAKLKHLLAFRLGIEAVTPDEKEILKAASAFAEGKDAAQTFRRLYVAERLLEKKIALPQVLEITREVTKDVKFALDSPIAASGIMADELYEPRRMANARGEILTMPEIPRATLDRILRGRIEDIAGRSLYNNKQPAEAVVRLKRAVSVLPENSVWWRLSNWRLGFALDENGKSKEALDAYIKSYTAGAPNAGKRAVIEAVYRRVYGSLDGLDNLIGVAKFEAVAQNGNKTPDISPTTISETPKNEVGTTETPKPVAPETLLGEHIKSLPIAPPEKPKEKSVNPPQIEESLREIKTESKNNEIPKIEVNTEETPKLEVTKTENEAKTEENKENKLPETAPTPIKTEEKSAEKTEVKPEVKKEIKSPANSEIAPKTEEKSENQLNTENSVETEEKTAENAEDKTSKMIEVRPRVVKIETEKERKQREKDEREALERRDKEEKRAAKERGKQTEEEKQSRKAAKDKGKNNENTSEEVAGNASERKSNADFKTLPVPSENTNSPTPQIPSCNLRILQSEVLISTGSSLALAVDIENLANVDEVKILNDKPNELKIERDTEIARISNGFRVLYSISSIGEKSGIYTVNLDSPCGKRRILVRVQKVGN